MSGKFLQKQEQSKRGMDRREYLVLEAEAEALSVWAHADSLLLVAGGGGGAESNQTANASERWSYYS